MRLRHLRASKGSKAGIRRAADGGPAIASDVRQKMGLFEEFMLVIYHGYPLVMSK